MGDFNRLGQRILALSVIWLLVAGCQDRTVRWKEEVQLEDGTVFIIKRRVTFREHNSWSGDAYGLEEKVSTISFKHPDEKIATWREALTPLLLYRDDPANEWVIVAFSWSSKKMRYHRTTIPAYWEFRLAYAPYRERGRWREVPLSKASIGRDTNLYFAFTAKDMPDFIDAATTRKYSSNYPGPTLLRRISIPDPSKPFGAQ